MQEQEYTKTELKEFHLFNKYGILLSTNNVNNVQEKTSTNNNNNVIIYQLSHKQNGFRLIHGNYSLCVYKLKQLSKQEQSKYHIIEYKK